MTLSVNEPSDQELVANLPYWIRQTRVAINTILAGAEDFAITVLTIAAGDTALVVGTDLGATNFEVVIVTGAGPATIDQIRGGTQGQIKLFIFQNNLVSFNDGAKADGELYLNQLPVGTDWAAQQDDVIALVNVGGDGSATFGYWKEIWRQESVK